MQRLTTTLFCVSLALLCYGVTGDKRLRFRSDGTFRVLQFTDLHYGESDERDINSQRAQRTVLYSEKPDLVVLSGDAVSGYRWDKKTKPWFPNIYKRLTAPMIEHNVPWAYIFGNHDDQGDYNRTQIVDEDISYPQSLTVKNVETTGLTNYILPIYATNGSKIAAVLYMLSSTDDECLGMSGWGCVYPDAVEWFRRTGKRLREENQGIPVPGLIYVHIPIPEYMDTWNYHNCTGRRLESISCSVLNTGLFAAAREIGGIHSIHCGHDHENDYYGNMGGIILSYGRKSGYGGYGPPADWLRGARVMNLSLDEMKSHVAHVDTWIRQEDGSVMSKFPEHIPKESDNQYKCFY